MARILAPAHVVLRSLLFLGAIDVVGAPRSPSISGIVLALGVQALGEGDAIDEYLRRSLTGVVDKPYGGKVFVLGGDFRQTGPVVKLRHGRCRRTAQVAHMLTSADVWQHVTNKQLTQNMHVQNCISSGNPEKAKRFQDFARDLLAVGNGTYRVAGRAVPTGSTSKMQIPPYVVWKPPTGEQHSPDAFFDFIYRPMRKRDGEPDDAWEVRRNQYLWSTAVLVSRNIEATEINHRLLDELLPDRPTYTFYSSNEMRNNEGYEHDWTQEYLAGVSDAGLPPHEICLKVGAPIIAMRNIMKGVVNGTRMIVTFVDDGLKFIRAKLLSESGTRQREVLITKSSSRSPHHEVLITLLRCTIQSGASTHERTQLPIRLAYALTINKAQGLTLKRVGLFLDKDVFAHGQVYVGMSRCGDPDNLFVYGNLDANGELWVANPVYKEILPKYT